MLVFKYSVELIGGFMKILIIEDTKQINDILTGIFTSNGYEVVSVDNAFDGLKKLEEERIVCVLTDLMLPILSGEDFIKKIRQSYNGLIIAITAKTSLADKLNVLELGADDYIMKPFNKVEILLKVRNYFKKLETSSKRISLNSGDLVFTESNNLLIVNSNEVVLTSVEYILVKTMMTSLNRIQTRDELIHSIYLDDLEVFDRAIDGHIKNIRKKIKKYSSVKYIETVYGLGYKFIGDKDE